MLRKVYFVYFLFKARVEQGEAAEGIIVRLRGLVAV